MGKIKVNQMIKDLKHIETRSTLYRNKYPFNCGYIWTCGYLSFDCIGMIKSYINDPSIAYKTEPAGFYVKPGQKIPDTTERGILNLCTMRSSDFKAIGKGAYMLYEGDGHGSIYVGKFTDPSGVVNTIECCDDPVGHGVVTSYTDSKGRRWDHKGGTCYGRYTEYGFLTKWVSYKEEKPKSITTIAKQVIAGKWGNYPEREKRLKAAGYDYKKVQKKVNELLQS